MPNKSTMPSKFCRSLFLPLLVFLSGPSMTMAQVVPVATVSLSPTPSNSKPSVLARNQPNITSSPTNFTSAPSQTTKPSATPTAFVIPTQNSTEGPTTTRFPSNEPSSMPSIPPSDMPSMYPTAEPTFATPSTDAATFRQKFKINNGRIFTESEQFLFQGLYRGYTINFASFEDVSEGRIVTICGVLSQMGLEGRRGLLRTTSRPRRYLQTFQFVEVDFTMTYESVYLNVSTFPLLFQSYVNQSLETVALQMRQLGVNVTEAFNATVRPPASPAPTGTSDPTLGPTMKPSMSASPSTVPSNLPSLAPTVTTSKPTIRTSQQPFTPSSSTPSSSTPTDGPAESMEPTGGNEKPGSDTTIIIVSIMVAGAIVLIGLFVYYRRRKIFRELEFQSNAATDTRQPPPHGEGDGNAVVQKLASNENNGPSGTPTRGAAAKKIGYLKTMRPEESPGGLISPSESLVSNQSLLSAGISMAGDSGDEADATQNLADEFDQYKDQNLEKMRADVHDNLTGFDGMMSQALTGALIDEDDVYVDPTELLWGGLENVAAVEIEASALGEVTDWLKRKENASIEEKRLFMQETLNKMVASVRHGVLGPDDASRSIHECAALLGLQLAIEIPVTTLIITGMPKSVTGESMIDAFSQFGEVSEAAVASNQRGFGILRFKNNKSVDRALQKFRDEEIVVQDVAVQVKVLRPGSITNGAIDTSAKPSAQTGANR